MAKLPFFPSRSCPQAIMARIDQMQSQLNSKLFYIEAKLDVLTEQMHPQHAGGQLVPRAQNTHFKNGKIYYKKNRKINLCGDGTQYNGDGQGANNLHGNGTGPNGNDGGAFVYEQQQQHQGGQENGFRQVSGGFGGFDQDRTNRQCRLFSLPVYFHCRLFRCRSVPVSNFVKSAGAVQT